MHSFVTSLFGAILFFVLTPGLFLKFPRNGSKWTVAGTHVVIFGILFYLFHHQVYRFFQTMEGATNQDATTPTTDEADKKLATLGAALGPIIHDLGPVLNDLNELQKNEKFAAALKPVLATAAAASKLDGTVKA